MTMIKDTRISMQTRIDPLIANRARWLLAQRPGTPVLRHALHRILGYGARLALAEHLRDLPAARVMAELAAHIARDVTVTGCHHIPAHGPALVVANHATGIADGIILHHVLATRHPDAFFFANADVLAVLPQLGDIIAPVEWRHDRRCHAKARATMTATRAALAAGRLGVIFPSGRLAKRRGLRLHERPWMASAAMLARKFDLPVIPVHIRARNSALFYAFDAIHPTLRNITLFHETLNKARQPFRLTIGPAIAATDLPTDTDAAIAYLRRATLSLGGHGMPQVSLLQASRRPGRA